MGLELFVLVRIKMRRREEKRTVGKLRIDYVLIKFEPTPTPTTSPKHPPTISAIASNEGEGTRIHSPGSTTISHSKHFAVLVELVEELREA